MLFQWFVNTEFGHILVYWALADLFAPSLTLCARFTTNKDFFYRPSIITKIRALAGSL